MKNLKDYEVEKNFKKVYNSEVERLYEKFNELKNLGFSEEKIIEEVLGGFDFGLFMEEEIYEFFEDWKKNISKNKREFKMYIKDNREEDDLIKLIFSIDGRVVDSCEYDNIGDILVESNKIFNKNCEKYNFSGMSDSLIVDLKFVW